MTPLNPAAHVELIAKRHGVRVVKILGFGNRAVAFPARKLIKIGELDGEDGYFTALHELGHIVLGHESRREDGYYTLISEYQAWKWAIDNAKYAPSRAMRGLISEALQTYVVGYPTQLPNKKHPFWSLALPVGSKPAVAGPRGRLP